MKKKWKEKQHSKFAEEIVYIDEFITFFCTQA